MRARFAPSPTGLLHLGHAFSALTNWDMTQLHSGEFLLRIEDIDQARSRPEFEAAIFEDLAWLGISWEMPVMRQSERRLEYQSALNTLIEKGICYPCRCSRRDIADAISAPQQDTQPASGPDGPIYPGTCRHRKMHESQDGDAIRLNMQAAVKAVGNDFGELDFVELGTGQTVTERLNADELIASFGDIVLARRDIGVSYHLAVVIDDAAQKITHVIRGQDISEATKIHRLLQALLDLPTPAYHHHRLILDDAGKRLAKRDDARAIRIFRQAGASPSDIRKMVEL
jgi:glutamyl-Q tRNA(Asp) synthetase